MFYKKEFLNNFAKFTGKHTLFFNKIACNFIEKETRVKTFSCKFCEIVKNTFFTEHLRTNAFVARYLSQKSRWQRWPNHDVVR